jgi:hypothetical protein
MRLAISSNFKMTAENLLRPRIHGPALLASILFFLLPITIPEEISSRFNNSAISKLLTGGPDLYLGPCTKISIDFSLFMTQTESVNSSSRCIPRF